MWHQQGLELCRRGIRIVREIFPLGGILSLVTFPICFMSLKIRAEGVKHGLFSSSQRAAYNVLVRYLVILPMRETATVQVRSLSLDNQSSATTDWILTEERKRKMILSDVTCRPGYPQYVQSQPMV